MTNRSRILQINRLVYALLLLLLVSGCEEREEEQEIVSVLEQAQMDLERESASRLIKLTSKGFIAHPGRMNRWSATKQLRVFFRQHGAVSIIFPQPEVQFGDSLEEASVNFPFILAPAGAKSSKLVELADDPEAWVAYAEQRTEVHRVELSMIKQGGRWLADAARFF